jgi:hypothetical protein
MYTRQAKTLITFFNTANTVRPEYVMAKSPDTAGLASDRGVYEGPSLGEQGFEASNEKAIINGNEQVLKLG